jgi:hypothetical protein
MPGRPIRIGSAILSSSSTWAARSTRSSSPSAKTTRFGRCLGCGERLHDQAGAEDEAVQLVDIGVHVLDRPPRDADLAAASATAGAIRRISRWSKGEGIR